MIYDEDPLEFLFYKEDKEKLCDWMLYYHEKLCEMGDYSFGNALFHFAIHQDESFLAPLLDRYGKPRKQVAKRSPHELPPQQFDIDAQNFDGNTVLHIALKRECSGALINRLLQMKPNLLLPNHEGALPIHYAAQFGRLSLVKKLLKQGPRQQVDARDYEGSTPLDYAIGGYFAKKPRYRLRIIKLLLDEYGVDLLSEEHWGGAFYGIWHCKSHSRGNELVEDYLLERMGLPKHQDGKHAFLDALYAGKYEALLPNVYLYKKMCYAIPYYEFLIPATQYPGWQPVHYAASMFPYDFDAFVKNYPVDLHARTAEEGYSLLHCAALYSHKNIIKKLVKVHKMDINLRDNQGQTPLHIMLRNGYFEAEFFSDLGVDMRATTDEGWSALHFAAMKLPWHQLKQLITDYKVPCHQVTQAGETALRIAGRYGRSYSMWALIHLYGLDPDAKNNAGKTAFDLAREVGYGNLSAVIDARKPYQIHLRDKDYMPSPEYGEPEPERDAVTQEIHVIYVDKGWRPVRTIRDILPLNGNEAIYPKLLPVFIKHLYKPYPRETQEAMVEALATPTAKGLASSALLDLYHRTPLDAFRLRWIIGYSVAVVATESDIPAILDIVKNDAHGATREMFIVALRNLGAKEAVPVLARLVDDEEPLIRLESSRTLAHFSSGAKKAKLDKDQ